MLSVSGRQSDHLVLIGYPYIHKELGASAPQLLCWLSVLFDDVDCKRRCNSSSGFLQPQSESCVQRRSCVGTVGMRLIHFTLGWGAVWFRAWRVFETSTIKSVIVSCFMQFRGRRRFLDVELLQPSVILRSLPRVSYFSDVSHL